MATPEFNVWSGPVDRDDQWVHSLTTSNLQDALLCAEQVGEGDVGSIVYELGAFRINGAETVDDVAFWWSTNLRETEGEPQGRGHGWSDNHQAYVTYTHPEIIPALTTAHNTPAIPAPPTYAYSFAECDNCGLQLSKKEMRRYSRWIAVGRTSASTRSSSSQSHRLSNRSTSTTYRHGSSASSGRTYYKSENLLLCSRCYNQQTRSDFRRTILKSLLYGGSLFCFLMYILSHHR